MIDDENKIDLSEPIVATTPVPEDVMDSLAPEQEVSAPEVVMPARIVSPEEIAIRKQLDYIKNSAAVGLGVENEYLGGDSEALFNAAQSEDKKTSIAALQAISVSMDYTPQQRALAAQAAYNSATSVGPAAPVTDKAARIVKYAVENELDEDGSLEDRTGVVDAFRNGDAMQQFDIENNMDNADDLAAFRSNLAKGGKVVALSELQNTYNSRSKLLSADTAEGFIPGGTELPTDRFYRQLGTEFPEIAKIYEDYGFFGSVVMRGHRDDDLMAAVAKMPDAKQIALAEKFIKLTKDSSFDSLLDHINVDVADVLFRRVVDPKSGKYTAQDVVDAEGVGATVATAMKTPVAEAIGRNVIRPLFAIVDYIPFATFAKGVVKASVKNIIPQIKASTRFIGLVRPKASAKLAVAAIESDDSAKALGYASREEAMIRMKPSEKSFYESPNIAYNVQQEVLAKARFNQSVLQELLSVSHTPNNIASPAALIDKHVVEAAKNSIVPHTAYTSIRTNGDVMEISGVFGKQAEAGYKSSAEALSTAKDFYGPVPVQSVIRHITTGTLIHPEDTAFKSFVKDAKLNPADYDWWARLDIKKPLWSMESEVVGRTSTNAVGTVLGGNNPISKHITSGLAQLVDSDILNKSSYIAGNSKFAVENFKKLTDFAEVMPAERRALSGILLRQNTDKDAVLYSSRQLEDAGISTVAGQAAYYNTKIALDNIKTFVDTDFAENLVREGFKDISGVDGARVAFGKEMDTAGLAVGKSYNVRVVDDGAEDVISLTGEALNKMAKDGFVLYESKIAEFARRTSDNVDVEATHVLVAKNIVHKQVSNPLPNGVLNYSPGYVPEIRTGRIVIEGVTESGRKHAIGFADSVSESKVILANMARDAKLLKKFPGGIGHNIYKGMSHSYQALGQRETYENLNGLVYGQKGDPIQNFSGINGDATMLDPLEAVEHMVSGLAQQYTKGRHIAYLEGLATDFATKNKIIKEGVSSVRTIDDLVGAGDVIGDRATARTKAANFLMHVEANRLSPDIVDLTTSKAWAAAASWGAKIQAGVLGRRFEKLAVKQAQKPSNPIRALTQFNYFTKIRTNPIKHRFQNMMSGMLNVSHPIAMAQGLKQRASFNAAVDLVASNTLSPQEIDAALVSVAKAFDSTPKAIKELVKVYREGGVLNAADNNILFRNTLETEAQLVELRALNASYKGSDIGAKIGGIWQNINKGLAEVGDVAGEREAMLTTFLTQYNALKGTKGFDIFSQASKEQLVSKTMLLSGNMVSEGALGMQKGWLRAMFQFHSYSVKMYWNALAPKILGGSRILTPQDKLGMAVTQLFMYGAGAVVGARTAATNAARVWANDASLTENEQLERNKWLVDSGVQRAVDNGVIGLFLNNYIKSYMAAYGDTEEDYKDLDVASFMAVTGGASIVGNTLRETMAGFGEAYSLMSAVGGPDGWWLGGRQAVATLGTTFMGVNGKMPANVMDSIMSIGRVTGSAYRGEAPLWAPADATRKAIAEHTFAASRPMVSLAMSRKYGEEIVNGKLRNRVFEDGLHSKIKMYFGIQTIGEKDAYELHKAMRDFNATNYYGSSGYEAMMKQDARNYVNGLVKDLVYLSNSSDVDQSNLREAVMNRHGQVVATELASMGTNDALAYEAAINDALTESLGKKDIESTVLEEALGMLSGDVSTHKDFSYLKKIYGNSPLIRDNPQTLDSYVSFLNNWVETGFGDYEE